MMANNLLSLHHHPSKKKKQDGAEKLPYNFEKLAIYM